MGPHKDATFLIQNKTNLMQPKLVSTLSYGQSSHHTTRGLCVLFPEFPSEDREARLSGF